MCSGAGGGTGGLMTDELVFPARHGVCAPCYVSRSPTPRCPLTRSKFPLEGTSLVLAPPPPPARGGRTDMAVGSRACGVRGTSLLQCGPGPGWGVVWGSLTNHVREFGSDCPCTLRSSGGGVWEGPCPVGPPHSASPLVTVQVTARPWQVRGWSVAPAHHIQWHVSGRAHR